jgi:selenide,water dikinase
LLDSVLRRLPRGDDPKLLVGYDTNDDAGVYQLNDEMALVETVDFFTPIVDDPHTFGQIAAANSLSDVYAMGGRPVVALTLIGFPGAGDPELMEQILRGGIEKMQEAGCTIAGGHSIRDEELKFGYAVSGLVHPRRIWRNIGAKAGDALFLTKPIGTGVIATALKSGQAMPESVAAAIDSMARLNRAAAEALREIESGRENRPVHAVTDVTGFGLLGHAREIAVGSDVSLEIEFRSIEYLPGALEAARSGFLAGGLKANREFMEGCVDFQDSVPEEYRRLLFDPQTSGGLFVAIEGASEASAVEAFERRGVAAKKIGQAVSRASSLVRVR